jgi:predicted DNA-binding transcriptional regulator
MVSQEEILELIISRGGAISTRELKNHYGIPKGNGFGHISQRLRQLMKKGIIAKVKGLNGEVIYFLIDLMYMNKEESKKYKYRLEDIEGEFKKGVRIKEVANKYGMSYMWAWRLHKRFLKEGRLYYKRDGRPYKQI